MIDCEWELIYASGSWSILSIISTIFTMKYPISQDVQGWYPVVDTVPFLHSKINE